LGEHGPLSPPGYACVAWSTYLGWHNGFLHEYFGFIEIPEKNIVGSSKLQKNSCKSIFGSSKFQKFLKKPYNPSYKVMPG